MNRYQLIGREAGIILIDLAPAVDMVHYFFAECIWSGTYNIKD